MSPNNQLIIWMDFQEGKDSYKKELSKKIQNSFLIQVYLKY